VAWTILRLLLNGLAYFFLENVELQNIVNIFFKFTFVSPTYRYCVLNDVVETMHCEQKTCFVDVGDIRKEVVEVFNHEEEVIPTTVMDMNKEILNIEDDDAYVEISNFIHLLDGPLHNEIYYF
jgi:hypothetical protein